MGEFCPLVLLRKLLDMLAKLCGKYFQHQTSMTVDKQRALVSKGCPSALRPFHQPYDPLQEKQVWKANAQTFQEGPQPQGRRFFAPGCILFCIYDFTDFERMATMCTISCKHSTREMPFSKNLSSWVKGTKPTLQDESYSGSLCLWKWKQIGTGIELFL